MAGPAREIRAFRNPFPALAEQQGQTGKFQSTYNISSTIIAALLLKDAFLVASECGAYVGL